VKRPDAAIAGAIVLFVVYALTLAPDVTFWDAGEFIAAAHSLGIPHPPGTPLFVLLTNAWARLFGVVLPYAAATNLFSAAATALAAGVTARMILRATGRPAMALAAALAAGTMSSVWLNATETEVYSVSLALGILMVWSGDRAGREPGERWTMLTAYLMALAVPLHLSALVVAPVAIALATLTPSGLRWRRAVLLSGAFVATMGVGRMSLPVTLAGVLIVAGALLVRDNAPLGRRAAVSLGAVLVLALGCSAIAFLYLRAAHDPTINQGNPETLRALMQAVSRRQYAVSPMWPREAPVWIQLANLGQYADWQVALSTGPTVMPSVLRTIGTVFFLWLGWLGATTHWRADRRTCIALIVLLVTGSLGVLVYLNMHAGPSILFGILPESTVREARERDYFYVFAFWAWGTWAGVGAITLAERVARPAWAGLLVAAVPLALNWRAVTRRGEPEQSLPRRFAVAMLEATPPRGVLFVAGDNDSYPLWYAQEVLGIRRDVAVVTIPLLPTRWYRSEVARRHGVLTAKDVERYEPRLGSAAAAADGARRANRPVAASITLTPAERDRLASAWRAGGMAFVAGSASAGGAGIDSVAARRWSEWVRREFPVTRTRPAIDPVNSYFMRLFDCPRQFLDRARGTDSTRLDSVCNYR